MLREAHAPCAALAALLAGACGDAQAQAPAVSELLVGVVPYQLEPTFCPQGPNRDSVFFKMDDEDLSHCSYESGDFGEGRWVLPQAAKYPIPNECSGSRDHTILRFCRTVVPANAFRPLTADPADVAQFYAVLKFGDRCPAHSIELSKLIVNEDIDTDNAPTGAAASDLLYPNEIVDGALGNFTRLFFCYFRSAPTLADVMSEFPDLGFPYAVFHDFEGPQPGWVIRKRWQYSDDSNEAQPVNRYAPDPELDATAAEFSRIVENPFRVAPNPRDGRGRDTCFDYARVR